MKVFLIILAVIVVLIVLIMLISAEFTVIFDNGWTTKIRILFIEKDIQLSKLLSFLVAPDKAGQEAAEKSKEKKKKKGKTDDGQDSGEADKAGDKADKSADKEEKTQQEQVEEKTADSSAADSSLETTAKVNESAEGEEKEDKKKDKKKDGEPKKKSPIQKILDEDGVVGLLLLVSNLLQTVNTAVTTLIKGLHIYSLYVKMIIGGGDAATIAEKYGAICGWYYPIKGIIMNQMKVDNYDDLITPDFIAPRSEYEFQFIGSISVGLLVKMLLRAAKTFLVNYIKNK